jgi:hypothetical protein
MGDYNEAQRPFSAVLAALQEGVAQVQVTAAEDLSGENALAQQQRHFAGRLKDWREDEDVLRDKLQQVDLEVLGYLVLGAATAMPTSRIAEIVLSLQEGFAPQGDLLAELRTVLLSTHRALLVMEIFHDFGQGLLRAERTFSEEEKEAIRLALREWFHLFNNVLVGITSYAELLQEDLPTEESDRGALAARVERLGKRVGRLVGQRASWQMQTSGEMAEGPWASMISERSLLLQLLTLQDVPMTRAADGREVPDAEGLAAVHHKQSGLARLLTDEVIRRLELAGA